MASAGLLLSGVALADEPAFQPNPGAQKPSKPAEPPPFVEHPSPAAAPEPAPSPITTAPAPSPIATAPAPSPPVAPMPLRPLGEPSARPAAPPRAAPKRAAAAQKAAPRHPKKAKRKRGDAATSTPAVTYPAFRMMEGGASRVFIGISKKVDVSEHKAQGQLVYRIQGADVLSRTNQLALDTTFFPTPVGRIRLVQQGADVDLVIDLREAVDVQYRIEDTRDGVVLMIDFPPTRLTGPTPSAASSEAEPGSRARARSAPETTRIGSGSGK